MTPRTYIWAGTRHPDEIPDSDHEGEGEATMIDNPEAGEPEWCFAYGEQEWMEGTSFENVENAASDRDGRGNPQEPEGRVNCETGAEL